MTDKDPFFVWQFSMHRFLSTYSLALFTMAAFFLCAGLCNDRLHADLVTISIADPLGSGDVVSTSDYVGIVDQASPLTITGERVRFNNLPSGEAIQLGDLLGSDMNAHLGDRQWEYLLALPGDAELGTGLENITFSGHAYERNANNLEGGDELTWQLFLNGSTTAIDSASSGAGVDFNSIDISLANSGGATINQIRVLFSVNGFNGGGEAFGTRGLLSATYNSAVPEPNVLVVCLSLAGAIFVRRRNRL